MKTALLRRLPRSIPCAAAITAIAAWCAGSPGQVRSGQFGPIVPPPSNTTVAVPVLEKHLPGVLADDSSRTLTLWAVTSAGLSVRYYSWSTNTWGTWSHWGAPRGVTADAPGTDAAGQRKWLPALPVIRTGGANHAELFALFAAQTDPATSADRLCINWWERGPALSLIQGYMRTSPPPMNSCTFAPLAVRHNDRLNPGCAIQTGTGQTFLLLSTAEPTQQPSDSNDYPLWSTTVSWGQVGGPTPGVNGLSIGNAINIGQPIVSTIPSPNDRGNPIVGPYSAGSFRIANGNTNSVVLINSDHGGEHRLFVIGGTSSGFLSGTRTAADFGNLELPKAANGTDLTNGILIDAPVAVAVTYPTNAFPSVNGFTSAMARADNMCHLYGRFLLNATVANPAAPASWDPWTDFGFPIDPASGQPLLSPGTKFRMTSAVSYAIGGGLRIHVFGNSDIDSRTGQPHRLIELYFDGASWSWSAPHDWPPNNLGVRTASSAVLMDANGNRRISVMCRTQDGSIFERSNIITAAGPSGWRWDDLSWQSALTSVPRISK